MGRPPGAIRFTLPQPHLPYSTHLLTPPPLLPHPATLLARPSQEAVQEARAVRTKSELVKTERDVFLYRSQIALGQARDVVDAIPDAPSTPASLQAVRLLAQYMAAAAPGGGGRKAREVVLLTLEDWLGDAGSEGGAVANPTLALVAGMLLTAEGDYPAAIKALFNPKGPAGPAPTLEQ